MNEHTRGILLHLLLKNPLTILIVSIVVIIVGFFSFLLMTSSMGETKPRIPEELLKSVYVSCQEGEFNEEIYFSAFEDAGAFEGMQYAFIQSANEFGIDPVLLTAIAFHETAYGKSNAVVNKNNPGGLMNPETRRLFEFDSLEEGIYFMAKNLHKNYISQGLVSIFQIGLKYAPIGASNDPNNLNIHWIPNVSTIANELGGLTMNCSAVNLGSGELFPPLPNLIVTSNFGYRVHPIDGTYKLHKGVDFGCTEGEPIYSALSGTVVRAIKSGYGGGYGHYVVINHGDKYTLYAHMTDVLVDVGDTVEMGTPVGTCGSTGASTAPHLHFEVQLGYFSNHVDPLPYLGM